MAYSMLDGLFHLSKGLATLFGFLKVCLETCVPFSRPLPPESALSSSLLSLDRGGGGGGGGGGFLIDLAAIAAGGGKLKFFSPKTYSIFPHIRCRKATLKNPNFSQLEQRREEDPLEAEDDAGVLRRVDVVDRPADRGPGGQADPQGGGGEAAQEEVEEERHRGRGGRKKIMFVQLCCPKIFLDNGLCSQALLRFFLRGEEGLMCTLFTSIISLFFLL